MENNPRKSILEDYIIKATELIKKVETNDQKKKDKTKSKEWYKEELKKFMIKEVNKMITDLNILERNKKHLETIKRKLDEGGINYLAVKAKTLHRLSIDASSEFGWMLDEIGLAWDPILDTPFIPSSTIKGLFRATLTWKIADELVGKIQEMKELKNVAESTVNALLGEGGDKGFVSKIAFLDAYPVKCEGNLVGLDVLTPMYSITKNQIGEDEAQPTPIFIPIVNHGVTFEFIIIDISRENMETIFDAKFSDLIKKSKKSDKNIVIPRSFSDKRIRELMNETIKEMLTVWGIGAKTSYNFGTMEIIKENL